MGCWIGEPSDLLKGDANNVLGYHELTEVVAINDGLLVDAGSTWNNPAPHEAVPVTSELASRMTAVCMKAREHERPALKDPRFCLTLPQWGPFLGEHEVIVMVRHPASVSRSLEHVHAIGMKEATALWYRYYEAVQNWPGELAEPLYVDYDMLLASEKRIQKMLKGRFPWLTYFHNRYAVKRDLRHHRYANMGCAWPARKLYERMQRDALSSLDDSSIGRTPHVRWNATRHQWKYERRVLSAPDIEPAPETGEAEAGLLDTDAPGR